MSKKPEPKYGAVIGTPRRKSSLTPSVLPLIISEASKTVIFNKNEYYGLRGSVNTLLKSHLKKKKQQIIYTDRSSLLTVFLIENQSLGSSTRATRRERCERRERRDIRACDGTVLLERTVKRQVQY
ncbi:hypothetical protein J6590_058869 [Homalodisca vitripennis]|nr:hypothetical protein J6590_058869 [Homalodisca vitripennis]